MLLLVTLALVVASAVLLILGFVQDALGFIYLSMLCAGVAALALFVFARLARRRGAALAGAGIAGATSPYVVGADHDEAPAIRVEREVGRTRQMAPVGRAADATMHDDLDYEEAEDPALVPAVSRASTPPPDEVDTWSADDAGEDWGDEILFPIEDYDELRVAEILPLLVQLEADELQEVRDREVAGKARGTILDRIDDRLGRRPAARADTAPIAVLEPEPAPTPTRGRPPARRTTEAAPAVKRASGRKAAAPPPAARARKAAAAPAATKATSSRKAAPAPAGRTAAKKASGSVGRAAAAPAAAGRAAAKNAAPVKKAVASRAAASSTTASKAAPSRATASRATTAKAAPVKKAVTKATKAAPAKKATKAAAKKR